MDDNSRLDCIDANLDSCEEKIKVQAKRIEELETENEQLRKWQIKPTEAICLTGLSCCYKKVFKND